jgi:N-methylhydantoinase A/oxoprolinase/acetone carboxylase beta subunit
VYTVSGGYYYDGKNEISPLNEKEIVKSLNELKEYGIKHIVVSGVYSPVNNTQERQVYIDQTVNMVII